jgi:hypothetical protein
VGDGLRIGMGAEIPTLEPLAQSQGIPLAPIVEEQVAKGPDDPSRWILNTVEQLGILSARTLQGLTTPENLALMALMATGNEEAILPKLANAGFSLEMARNGVQAVRQGIEAAKKGNLREAGPLFASGAANMLLIGLANRKKPGEVAEKAKEKTPGIIKSQSPETPTPEEFAAKKPPLPPEVEGIMAGVASQPSTELLQSVPEAPDRRLDRSTRFEVDDFLKVAPKGTTREEALQAVMDVRKETSTPPSAPAAAGSSRQTAPPEAPKTEATDTPKLELAPPKAPQPGPPQPDPGWKLSLGSMSAEKARAFGKRHSVEFGNWKLVDDPQNKGKYYISYQAKEKAAPSATAPRAIPIAPQLPAGEPESPVGMLAEASHLMESVMNGRTPSGKASKQAIDRANDLEMKAKKALKPKIEAVKYSLQGFDYSASEAKDIAEYVVMAHPDVQDTSELLRFHFEESGPKGKDPFPSSRR